jgi:hypothetical protein
MKVLFYTSSDFLTFEAPPAILTEVFDFGRVAQPQTDQEDANGLFLKLLSQTNYLEGDQDVINVAFASLLQSASRATDKNAVEIRSFLVNPAADEDCLVYGVTHPSNQTPTQFAMMSMHLEEFEEQVKLHKSFSDGAAHGQVGIA